MEKNPIYIPPSMRDKAKGVSTTNNGTTTHYIPPSMRESTKLKSTYQSPLGIEADLNAYQSQQLDYSKATDLLDTFNVGGSSLDVAEKASKQGIFEQGANMLYRGFFTAGTLALKGLIEPYQALEDTGSELLGGNADFSNPALKWLDKTMKDAEQTAPIYLENPGKAFDIGDTGWWANGVNSIASTIGMFYGAKGVMNMANLAKVGRLGTAYESLGLGTKDIIKAATMSMLMRDAENKGISSDVYNSILNSDEVKKIDTMSDEEFNNFKQKLSKNESFEASSLKDKDRQYIKEFIASSGGWKSYADNAANIVFDFIQVSAMMGLKVPSLLPDKFGGFSNTVLKAQAASIGKTLTKADLIGNSLSRFGRVLAIQGTEGIEEIINEIAQRDGISYGKYLALHAKDDAGVASKFNEYLKDPLVWEQGFWGVVGGIGSHYGLQAADYIKNKVNGDKATEDDIKLDEINTRAMVSASVFKAIDSLNKGFDPSNGQPLVGNAEQIKESKEQIKDDLIDDAISTMQLNAAISGNVELFKDWIKSDSTRELFTKLNIGSKEDIDGFLDRIEKGTDNVNNLYNKFLYSTSLNSVDSKVQQIVISQGVNSSLQLEKLIKENSRLNKDINELVTNNEYLNSLTPEQRTEVNSRIENAARKVVINSLENIKDNNQKSQGFKAIETRINSLIKELESKQELKEDGTPIYTLDEKDNLILNSLIRAGLDRNIVQKKVDLLLNEQIQELSKVRINEVVNNKKYQKEIKDTNEEIKRKEYDNLVTKTKASINQINEDTPDFENTLNQMEKDFYAKNSAFPTNEKDFPFKQRIETLNQKASIKANKESKVEPIIETPKNASNIKSERYYNQPANRVKKYQAEGENTDLTQDEIDEIEQIIEAAKRSNWDKDRLFRKLNTMGFVYAIGQEASFRNYLEDRLKGLTNIKVTSEYNFFEQLNKELGIETKDNLTDFSIEEQKDINDYLEEVKQSDEETLNNIINTSNEGLEGKELKYHEIVVKIAKETLAKGNSYDSIIINDEDKISNTGGDNSFNIFLGNGINATTVRKSNGDLEIQDNVNAVSAILNNLKEGDTVEVGYATKEDFPNVEEWKKYNQDKTEEAIGIRVKFRGGEIANIGFINSTNYLEKELNLVTALNDYSNEADLKQIYENLHLVVNRQDQEAWSTLKKNQLVIDTIDLKADKEELRSQLQHLYNILYFGQEKITDFNYDSVKQSLHNWYLKINRDLTNSNKIKEQLKVTPIINTTIAYSTSGTILRSVDSNGNTKLRSINDSFSDNEEIFITSKFDKTVLKGSNGKVYTANKEYREKAFVLIKTKGEPIPQELIVNSLKSKKDSTIDTKTTELVTSKIKDLLNILKSGSGINSPLFISNKKELGEIVIVNDSGKDARTFLKFYNVSEDVTQPYAKLDYKGMMVRLYLDNNGELVAYSNNIRIVQEDIEEIISSLNRSFNYERILENKNYTSPTTGINYNSYVDFLIKEDILLTDVGKLVTKSGQKISNMAIKDDTGRNSRPLIININSTGKAAETKVEETKPTTVETVETLLEDFSKTKYSQLYNKAKKLKINFNDTLLKIGETIPNSDKVVNENTRGAFSPINNTIYFTENVLRTNNERRTGTIGHEILHGVLKNQKLTEEQVNQIKQFNKDLLNEVAKGDISEEAKELLKDSEVTQILKLLENEEKYEEVITYGFENAKFAKFLLKIESKDVTLKGKLKYKHRTFWGRLRKIISDIVDTIFTGTSKLDELNYILNDIFRKTDGVKKATRGEEKEARRNQIYQRTNESSRQETEYILRQLEETEQELANYIENKDFDVEQKILQNIPIINKDSATKETGAKVGIGKDIHLSKASPSSDITVDAAAHSIWESLSEEEQNNYDTQVIRNIILDYLTSSETKTSKEKELKDKIKSLEEQLDNIDNVEPEIDFQNIIINDEKIQYQLKSINILQSTKADEIFRKGDKNNWDIDKILLELNIPKEQKELIKTFNTRNREEILTNLLANYSYTVEINIAKGQTDFAKARQELRLEDLQAGRITREQYQESLDKEKPTQYYSNLTVPGGTNYTENEIKTPNIIPSIKGHAAFSTNSGIGWFRSDESSVNIDNIINELKMSGKLIVNCG